MASALNSGDLKYLGWCPAYMTTHTEACTTVAHTKDKLDRLVRNFTMRSTLKSEVDLRERDIVFITIGKEFLEDRIGVYEISDHLVKIALFSQPVITNNRLPQLQTLVFSAEKYTADSIRTEFQVLDVFQEPEFKDKDINNGCIREAKMKQKEAVLPYHPIIDEHLEREAYFTEMPTQERSWFKRLNPKEQALALRKLKANVEYHAFRTRIDDAFALLEKRLSGKSYLSFK